MMHNEMSASPNTRLSDENVLTYFKSVLNDNFLSLCNLSIKKNKSNYNSVMISARDTLFRESIPDTLLCRVRQNSPSLILDFNKSCLSFLTDNEIPAIELSDGFCRVDFSLCNESFKGNWACALDKIISSAFSLERFGCCSKYIDCSDSKKCVHPDYVFATACQYKTNLESGRIFYGKNKNC